MTDEAQRNDADETVARIDAALAGITPGEWHYYEGTDTISAGDGQPILTFEYGTDRDPRLVAAAPSLLRDARAVIVAQQAELREAVVRLRFMRARDEACTESFALDAPFDAGAWRRVELGTATREDYDALYATLKELDDDDE